MSSGYEQIYESLIPKLSECDFSEIAERLGLSAQQEGTLAVNFLGREYEISSCGIKPTDGKPVNVNNRSVLAYYTLSPGRGEPEFSYMPVSNLAGSGIIFSSTTIKWMTAPLGKLFSGDYGRFSPNNGQIRWGLYWQVQISRSFMAAERIAKNPPPNCLL